MSMTEKVFLHDVAAPRWRQLVARGLETLIGGVLLIAGLLKAWEPLQFTKQITDYKLITAPGAVKAIAWTAIVLECGLGAALIVGWRRRLTVPLAIGLFVIFLGAIGWAWASGSTADCGCFGSWVKRTPAEAFAEDVLMLGALMAAWFLHRREPMNYARLRLGLVSAAIVAGLAVTGWSSQSARQSSDPNVRQQAAQNTNPFSKLHVALLSEDLSKGTHLIALIDTGCSHCQAAVPSFNQLMVQTKNNPPFVALCSNLEEEVKQFKQNYNAQFPLGIIARQELIDLLNGGGTPHTLLVKDGFVLHVWDGDIPTPIELFQLLPESRPM
ncbi:MAG: MauE/DoxX family redox-associated membrane protein [Blastocatellia bacterium]